MRFVRVARRYFGRPVLRFASHIAPVYRKCDDMGRLSQVRAISMMSIALIGMLAFGNLRAEEWSRTITLKIAADPAFRQRSDWQGEIRKSVEIVSAIWERQFGIRWTVVDFSPWAPPTDDKLLTSSQLFGHLKSVMSPSNADVVLGIYERKCLHDYGGLSDFFGASALVITGCLRQSGSRNTIEMVLSHELAHLFGAFHVRPHIRSVMSGDGPDIFDPQTSRIIRLMRDRDFVKGVNSIQDLATDKQDVISALFSEGHIRDARNPIATAFLISGEFLLESSRHEDAVEAFRKASGIDSRWPAPHTGMGIAYTKLGKQDLAIASFKTALAIDPADARANEFMAHAKIELGDEKGALGNFVSAVNADPRSAALRNNLGLGYMSQGKLREAESEFKAALRLDPKIPDVYSNLAAALGQQGKLDEAARISREAIRLDPKDSKVQGNLGYTLEMMGDIKGALEAYRTAQALDPLNSRNRVNLDRLLNRINKNEAGKTRRK